MVLNLQFGFLLNKVLLAGASAATGMAAVGWTVWRLFWGRPEGYLNGLANDGLIFGIVAAIIAAILWFVIAADAIE